MGEERCLYLSPGMKQRPREIPSASFSCMRPADADANQPHRELVMLAGLRNVANFARV